jgi:hypothetical protein
VGRRLTVAESITAPLVEFYEEEKEQKTTKPFLKRKTLAIKPKKINWQTKSKIDCWNNVAAGSQIQKEDSS